MQVWHDGMAFTPAVLRSQTVSAVWTDRLYAGLCRGPAGVHHQVLSLGDGIHEDIGYYA